MESKQNYKVLDIDSEPQLSKNYTRPEYPAALDIARILFLGYGNSKTLVCKDLQMWLFS